MNRTRINQMLGVLLFPYLDPELQKTDCYRERYKVYREYLDISGNHPADLERKQKKNKEFQEATEKLIEYLRSGSRTRVKSCDDLLMLCEFYFPITELERREGKESDSILGCYLENLAKIATSLLTYRDGVIAIRFWTMGKTDIFDFSDVFDKVQIWNMLCCYMVPDVLIVAFAVECNLSIDVLYRQKPYISMADKLFARTLQKGMAENHLHFNAGFDYESIWLNAMNLRNRYKNYKEGRDTEEKRRENLWAAALFRILAAEFFMNSIICRGTEKQGFVSWVGTGKDPEALRVIWGLYSGEQQGNIAEKAESWGWLRDLIASHERKGEADYLLADIYKNYMELQTSSEFILLFHCLTYLKACHDECFARIFLQYLRIKNNWFYNIQQSNLLPGLRHFQKYFNAARQAEADMVGWRGMALDTFRAQGRQIYLRKLEIRITPEIEWIKLPGINNYGNKEYIKEVLCKQLYQVFYLYRRYLLESTIGVAATNRQIQIEERELLRTEKFSFNNEMSKSCDEKMMKYMAPTLGIVYHLLKMENLENISGYSCARIIKETSGLNYGHRLFMREGMTEITEVIEELRGEVPFMNEYVVGLDAAADENAMEPWMFAPAYNRMRRKEKTKPVIQMNSGAVQPYSLIQNMGFTYHVGEDFRHIASGLRHVDEVIERFHYKSGDRLGHAIALGTDIDSWAEEHEMAVLPLGEYLDNLLWIWGEAVYEGIDLSVQLERLEKEILEKAEEIYGENNGIITVMMLYEAYKEKFSSDHRSIIERLNREIEKINSKQRNREKEDKEAKKKRAVRGYCKYMECDCESCMGSLQLWDKDKLTFTNYCPVFEDKRNRVIQCTIRKNDVIIYKELQEHLLQKIERKGIYVEANPTSNVTIGEIEDLRDLPIFRMSSVSPEGHHVMATINSDDPAVFNTNVENELSYIYHAMGHSGYAKEDILNWIDKIRQNGMDASFIHKVKDVGTMLREIGSILDELSRCR